jgi:hypothetical protein
VHPWIELSALGFVVTILALRRRTSAA